jgi:serine/threonine protein kinase/Tol biopolymer transport system component
MAQTLRSGNTVSHYRVVSSIGAGGMGEVYKAIDDALGRPVALKILPPDLVKNEERVNRFVQEAKSASSLSHPNIVHIYEIGHSEDPPVHFIAMELVDGSTLKRRIHDEQTDLRTLLGYLAQAADALAKAHTSGIVHRDLKPENIMISKDGYAKVLDFGLAKLTEKLPGEAATNAPTAQRERTREGVVMGTVPYMSPEQVQGKPVDHRSDIFSFGSILYEAATGRRAFDGDTDVDIMHKILHEKPQRIEEINPRVPAELRRVIRRCLNKDPGQRSQSMKDLCIELNEIVDEWDDLSATEMSVSSGSGPTAIMPAKRSMAAILATGASIVVAIAALLWALLDSRDRTGPQQQTTFSKMQMRRLTGSGNVWSSTVSPDGKYIAYSGAENGQGFLTVRQVATGAEARVVAPSRNPIWASAFSIDGDYLYYIQQEGLVSTLFQIPSLGGIPQKLIFDIDSAVTFSPDGKQFAFTRGYLPTETALMVANADGTGLHKLATSTGKERYHFGPGGPAWSPDGKSIALSKNLGSRDAIAIVDVASSKEAMLPHKTLFHRIQRPAWLPDGSGLIAPASTAPGANHQLWIFSVPAGTETRITNDLADYGGVTVTTDGRKIASTQTQGTSNLWSVNADGSSPVPLTQGAEMFISDLRTTPDRHIFIANDGSGRNVWSSRLDGIAARPIIRDPSGACCLALTPDGKTILFVSGREGGVLHVFRAEGDGSNVRRMTSEAVYARSPAISPDGTWFAYQRAGGRSELMRASLAGGPAEIIATDFWDDLSIAPDGSSMTGAFTPPVGSDSAHTEIRAYPVRGGAPKVLPFTHEYTLYDKPRWIPTGAGMSYIHERSNVWIQRFDGSPPVQLTNFSGGIIWDQAWSADGTTLFLARGEWSSDVVLISDFK